MRGDLAGRALRLIGDGVIDREGVPGLARRLGYSERQVHRTLVAEVGAGPLALARAQRAQTARVLLETTDLPVTDVAFAAGFASVRQFNDTVREVFADHADRRCAPRGARRGAPEPGVITLRLPYRAADRPGLHARLPRRARACPDVETYADGGDATRRVLRRAAAARRSSPWLAGDGRVLLHACGCTTTAISSTVVARVRRLLDLDADPVAVDAALGSRPGAGPAGRASARACARPGPVDGFETGGPDASSASRSRSRGARTVLGRIVAEHGERRLRRRAVAAVPRPRATLAAVDPATLPMPRARGRTVVALAAAVADGDLDARPRRRPRRRPAPRCWRLPGIGPWTADYLRMRALADPDVLLAGDLVRAPRRGRPRHRPDGRPPGLGAVAHLRHATTSGLTSSPTSGPTRDDPPPKETPMMRYTHIDSPLGDAAR